MPFSFTLLTFSIFPFHFSCSIFMQIELLLHLQYFMIQTLTFVLYLSTRRYIVINFSALFSHLMKKIILEQVVATV